MSAGLAGASSVLAAVLGLTGMGRSGLPPRVVEGVKSVWARMADDRSALADDVVTHLVQLARDDLRRLKATTLQVTAAEELVLPCARTLAPLFNWMAGCGTADYRGGPPALKAATWTPAF
eukprot:6742747-Lingulodinium_polyedra.AAC.1